MAQVRKGRTLKNWLGSRGIGRAQRLAWLAVLLHMAGCGQSTPPAANHQEPPGEIEARQTAERYDLTRDEARGGHTLIRHVGLTDVQLQERLDEERNISAASSWTDQETAEVAIAQALRAEHGRIENWINRGTPRANLALHYNAGQVIGRSLKRGENHAVDCTRAVIVLRASGERFYVLTAYPEADE